MSEGSLFAKPENKKPGLAGVTQARAAMLAGLLPLDAENIALRETLDRTLAENMTAARDQPPFAVSEMDGYALRAGATPGQLRLAGESAAGRGFMGICGPGEVIRISTGAALPEGADAVVMQEDVTREGDAVRVPRAAPGQHVRRQGLDFKAGVTLLEKGRLLDGVAMALAAAMGMARLPVVRRPRVAILSGGDELAEPGDAPGPFQIFDSGTFGIAGLIAGWGAAANRLALEKDNVDSIARAAERGLSENDLLVVIGGASVGDHDHARPALKRLGLDLAVEKVNLRPGKPSWFGRVGGKPVLGLPGNPASALVCAHLFLKPIIATLLGRDADPRFVKARLCEALSANGVREHYLRARLSDDGSGGLGVRAFEQQDSSLLSVFAAANALIRLNPGAPAAEAGALVDVLPLGAWG